MRPTWTEQPRIWGRICAAALGVGLSVALAAPVPARPSDPGVVNYAVLGKGSVGNIVGARMTWERYFNRPFQGLWVDLPACNDYVDIGLPDVYDDPDLASFNGAETKSSATDDSHFTKQAVGVFATTAAAEAAFRRLVDRTAGCAGQTTAVHLSTGETQLWSFTGGPVTANDASWSKQLQGTDRRCFVETRQRENVLLQAKVCQSGNAGPAVNVLAGAMQNMLLQ